MSLYPLALSGLHLWLIIGGQATREWVSMKCSRNTPQELALTFNISFGKMTILSDIPPHCSSMSWMLFADREALHTWISGPRMIVMIGEQKNELR